MEKSSMEVRKQFVEIFVNVGLSPVAISEIAIICDTDEEIVALLDFVEANGEQILANPKAWESAILNKARQIANR